MVTFDDSDVLAPEREQSAQYAPSGEHPNNGPERQNSRLRDTEGRVLDLCKTNKVGWTTLTARAGLRPTCAMSSKALGKSYKQRHAAPPPTSAAISRADHG